MKIVTLNFNKYEILSRKNFFTTLTNEKKILMCNTIEDVVKESPNIVFPDLCTLSNILVTCFK